MDRSVCLTILTNSPSQARSPGSRSKWCKAKTVDLMVPANSEIVIEGLISTELLEPEGPFGESTGYVALEDYNLSMEVTAITHRNRRSFRQSSAK